MGGDWVGAVQSDAAVGEVAQTAKHGLEVWNLFLQRGREEGRGGEGTGEGREWWFNAHSMCASVMY